MALPLLLGAAGVTGRVISTQYYDRLPLTISQAFSALNFGPHSLTTRWTYTAPTGRNAAVTSVVTNVDRVTVASNPAQFNAQVTIFDGSNDIPILMVSSQGNAVDSSARMAIGSNAVALPGQSVRGKTADASTGGTVDYQVASTIVEFDK